MKISVIGAGAVGAEIANYLFLRGLADEIVLVNRERGKAEGEAFDMELAKYFFSGLHPVVRAGDAGDIINSGIVVIAAGVPLSGEINSKEKLALANAPIILEIMRSIEKYAPGAIVIIASNPVETLTHLAFINSGLSPKRIISSGTLNDTGRLKYLIHKHTAVSPENINAYVLGEHSACNFIPWSICDAAGMSLDSFCLANSIEPPDKDYLLNRVNGIGYEILANKGFTNHAIAASVCRIIQSIVADENAVLPVGSFIGSKHGMKDITISLPAIINRQGIGGIVNYQYTEIEIEEMHRSAKSIMNTINLLNKTKG